MRLRLFNPMCNSLLHLFDRNNIGQNSVHLTQSLPSPRFIKSHLPWQLLPKGLSTVKPKVSFFSYIIFAFQKRLYKAELII